MRYADALTLGAVQGLTEFLPVSSSAHLLLTRRALRLTDAPLAFDVALHLATAASLVAAAGPELTAPFRALVADAARQRTALDRYRPASRLALCLVAANVPAVIAGALLHDRIEAGGRGPRRVAGMLAAGSVVLAAAGRLERAAQRRTISDLTIREALLVGVAQAAALLPGVSRSGATITAGLALGLDRAEAVRFSFLLAAPITLAAGVRTLPALPAVARETGWGPLLAGAASAAITGLLGIALLRRAVVRAGLGPFLGYRLALATAVLSLPRRYAGQSACGSRPR
jgi:undecaprenyl-diphosphatase